MPKFGLYLADNREPLNVFLKERFMIKLHFKRSSLAAVCVRNPDGKGLETRSPVRRLLE